MNEKSADAAPLPPSSLPGEPVLIVRYGEIGLKGGNRRAFEKALAANIKHALKESPHGPVERPRGRIVVRRPSDPEAAARAAARVFGVTSVSPGYAIPSDPEAILAAARFLVREALAERPGTEPVPFRVSARRNDKAFPLTSMELAARLGGELLASHPRLRVDLNHASLDVGVEVRTEETLVHHRRLAGPGGIPVGTTGRAVVLLSGGIDSPVAAYLAMKRGARLLFITFHSYPFISRASLKKVEEIVGILARFQRGAPLFTAPFADIQVAIKRACPEALRTVLYRRMMVRLACRLARREGALCLVTGESLGQVASQTMENIRAIAAPSDLPVLRPLVGFDKTETISLARRIGTYRISIQPYPDSCTVFQPRNPRIRSTLEEVERAEEALDIEGLTAASFEGMEEKVIF